VDSANQFLAQHRLGDWASIVGLAIGLLALFVTFLAWRAATRAAEAARKAKEAVYRAQGIADVSALISLLNEVKRLHRSRNWEMLLDRYAKAREMLMSIEHSCPHLPQEVVSRFPGIRVHLRGFETKVEREMGKSGSSLDVTRFNAVIAVQVDELCGILEGIKQEA